MEGEERGEGGRIASQVIKYEKSEERKLEGIELEGSFEIGIKLSGSTKNDKGGCKGAGEKDGDKYCEGDRSTNVGSDKKKKRLGGRRS